MNKDFFLNHVTDTSSVNRVERKSKYELILGMNQQKKECKKKRLPLQSSLLPSCEVCHVAVNSGEKKAAGSHTVSQTQKAEDAQKP